MSLAGVALVAWLAKNAASDEARYRGRGIDDELAWAEAKAFVQKRYKMDLSMGSLYWKRVHAEYKRIVREKSRMRLSRRR